MTKPPAPHVNNYKVKIWSFNEQDINWDKMMFINLFLLYEHGYEHENQLDFVIIIILILSYN